MNSDNQNHTPPKWPFHFLKRICPDHLYEEIEGDLIQKFNRDIKTFGEKKAKRRLAWNVIRFLRPDILLRNKFSRSTHNSDIFQSYFKISCRNLLKRRTFSFINIVGLAIGLSVCLLIWSYVAFELSYENFHANGKNIYRALFTDYKNGEKTGESPRFGFGLGPALLQDLPEIESYVRVREEQSLVSYKGDSDPVQYMEDRVLFVDSTFLNVFTFEVLKGRASHALDKPLSIVITESAAKKYFGNQNPIGKMLRVFVSDWTKNDYEITAVLEDVPQNSDFNFQFLVPIHSLLQAGAYREPNAQWNWVNFITYLKVYPDANVEKMNSKTDVLLTKYTGPNPPGTFIFTFQSLDSIHLSEKGESPFNSVYFFMGLSFFILMIAYINYVNLSTARALDRAKEVGIKKAMGVVRSQLVFQFIIESFVITLLGIALALIFAVMLLPLLGDMIGKTLSLDFTNVNLWLVLIGFLVVGSLVSGLYPAILISSFKITDVVKGMATKNIGGLSLRKSLVVFQFTSSMILLFGTFTIYRQIDFMQQHSKGMNTEKMLVVEGPRIIDELKSEERLQSFKNELLKNSFVDHVTSSGSVPTKGFSLVTGMTRLGSIVEASGRQTVYAIDVDKDFTATYNLQIQAGRNWNPSLKTDEKSVLISEAALVPFELGDAENALKEKLIIDHTDTVSILGVFKNANWNSLQTAHLPLLLQPHQIIGDQFSIKLNGNVLEAVGHIERLYKELFPGNPFNFYFLNDSFNEQYKAEQQFGKIIFFFTALAVLIACLGLWGLASYSTMQRLKEISIRKVLGASVNNIVTLLARQFIKLVFIASLIAIPIGWYGAVSWLTNFAFRINLSLDVFAIPLITILIITLITISFQTINAALTNPSDHLKNE